VSFDLTFAFWLLCAAVVLGGALALPYLHHVLRRLSRPIRIAHGALGAAGLAALLLVLRRGLPPSTEGTTGFGPAAAVLLVLALTLGLLIALRRRRPPGLLVATHASLAIAGFVVLWTLVSLG
jgi:hypothetical protein